MSGGAWSNDQARNLILPPGAGPTDAQIVIGPDVPADLQTFWQSGSGANSLVGSGLPANFPFTVIGAILFYDTGAADYGYLALVDGNNGVNHYAYFVTGFNSAGVGVHQAWAIIRPAGGPTDVLVGTNISNDKLDIVNALHLLTASASTVDGQLIVTTTGSLVGTNSSGAAETWHAFPFANGWTNSGGAANLQYRRTALREVQLIGTIHSPNPFNQTIGTLPAGYRPLNQQGIWAWTNTGSGQLIRIDNAGVCGGFGSTAIATDWWVNGTFSTEL
jgi:hypothetical protein